MEIQKHFKRAARHRFYGVLWRVGGAMAAAYAWHYGYGEILAALIVMGCGLVAAAHDLVATNAAAIASSKPVYVVTHR